MLLFFFEQLDKKGKVWDLAGFDWIHCLGGTLNVASACLVADLLK